MVRYQSIARWTARVATSVFGAKYCGGRSYKLSPSHQDYGLDVLCEVAVFSNLLYVFFF
jgi:hypothetical protein